MKISYFQQVPYRSLPEDFESKHESVVTTPYHDLVTPEGVRSAFKDALGEMMFAARCGFDGIAMGALMVPPLTSVEQPSSQIGATACAQLLARLQGGQTRSVRLPHRILPGGTVAAPPTSTRTARSKTP